MTSENEQQATMVVEDQASSSSVPSLPAGPDTTTTTTTTFIREKGQAPLKKEFIVELERLKQALGHKTAGDGSRTDAGDDGDDASSQANGSASGDGGGSSSNDKGPKKKRNRGVMKVDEEEPICRNFLQDRCLYGDKCKYPHNTLDYMKRKPEVSL